MSDNYKYTYWLKIDYRYESHNGIEWKNLKRYADNYDCNITVFCYDSNFMDKVIKLECNQLYNDLDLDVNSMSDGSFIYLKQKPNNITKAKDINYFFEKYAKYEDGMEL